MTTTYCRRSIPTFRCNDFFIMPHNNFPILSYSIIQLQCSRTINQAPARVLHVSQLRKTGPTRIYVPREARKRALDCVASTPTMGLRMAKFKSVFSPPAWYPAYALGYRKIFRVQWTEVYSNFLEPATPGRPASGGRISIKQQTAWTGAAFKARERYQDSRWVSHPIECTRTPFYLLQYTHPAVRTLSATNCITNVPQVSMSGTGNERRGL
jgi:hypothetical protein